MSSGAEAGAAEASSTEPEALARLERFGGRTLLNEMIALFLRSAPDRLSAAAAGVSDGDAAATENALHALKSSSAQLGAVRLSRLCDEGEAIARTGRLSSLGELLDASRRELESVEAWLNGVRAERPA
jgi:two-component system sensor histidine kinase RpfC